MDVIVAQIRVANNIDERFITENRVVVIEDVVIQFFEEIQDESGFSDALFAVKVEALFKWGTRSCLCATYVIAATNRSEKGLQEPLHSALDVFPIQDFIEIDLAMVYIECHYLFS